MATFLLCISSNKGLFWVLYNYQRRQKQEQGMQRSLSSSQVLKLKVMYSQMPHSFLRQLVIPHVMGRTSPLSCWVLCLWWCCWPCQDFQLLHNFREWRSLSWVPAISIPPTNTIFMSQYCCRTTYGTTTAVYGHNRFAIPGWLGAESFLPVTRYYYFMHRQEEAWA